MPFLRTGAGKATVIAGLGTALAVWLFVDFSADTGPAAKLVMAVFLGGLAAYGVWSAAGIPALIADLIGLARGRRTPPAAPPVHHQGALPVLAPARKGLVRRVVSLMEQEGLFAPEVPDPALLFSGVADWDGPVTQEAVLNAAAEADYWHPDCNPAAWFANLVSHGSHSEQFADVLRAQIADLVRLAGGALTVRDLAIDLAVLDGRGPMPPCTIAMTVNGAAVTLRYAPAAKYLSTHLHVTLARALRTAGVGRRLAWLWTDQGPWIACLRDGAVERLNAGPGHDRQGYGGWSWIDEADPIAAGDPPPPT